MLNPRSIPACGELFDIEMIDDPIHRSALACAGNSHSCWIFNINQSVHPRLRGELTVTDRPHVRTIGSSPLTRGTRNHSKANLLSIWFIPAYAGNSSELVNEISKGSVHPRLRGELRPLPIIQQIHAGSSPLTRGTLLGMYRAHKRCRFIPAYAGNSPGFEYERPSDSVHPRLRGEL